MYEIKCIPVDLFTDSTHSVQLIKILIGGKQKDAFADLVSTDCMFMVTLSNNICAICALTFPVKASNE